MRHAQLRPSLPVRGTARNLIGSVMARFEGQPDRGWFITLEGIEGVGKSVQGEFIVQLLRSGGRTVRFTREPGGTTAGEAIRDILLHGTHLKIDDLTELLLIFSARAQHLAEVIRPALGCGEVVVCDRFTDATYAYQGGGRNVPMEQIRMLEQLVQQDLRPDLTLLLDTDVSTGLARAGQRGAADRFEGETQEFFRRVRAVYLERAAREPDRFRVVDAGPPVEQVQREISAILGQLHLC